MLVAPFPWFGGKRRAAPIVWEALGDPGGYVEPFAGSAAVLLARAGADAEGWRRVETLNDADGWLVNAWRAIQQDPVAVADACFGPMTEIDYHARLAWLQERRTPELVAWLEGDPDVFDARAAGWWLYVCAAGIGDPFGRGPWRVIDGHLRDTRKLGQGAVDGVRRKLPHLGDAGRGVNRELPHLGDAGQGDLCQEHCCRIKRAAEYDKARLDHYLTTLANRLRRVNITCGDWRRVLKPSVLRSKTGGDRSVGIFLDPPYTTGSNLYGGDDLSHIAAEVTEWCLTADPGLRVVLAGYDGEHNKLEAHGWRRVTGKSTTGKGYGKSTDNAQRERLWLSPSCRMAAQEREPEALVA